MTSGFFDGLTDGQIAEHFEELDGDYSDPPEWWLEQEAERRDRVFAIPGEDVTFPDEHSSEEE